MQKFFNNVYETNPVGVAGSLTCLIRKLALAIAAEEKNVTKEKKCRKPLLCNASVLMVGAVVSSKMQSKSYTKRDQLASSAHDPTIMTYWRDLL